MRFLIVCDGNPQAHRSRVLAEIHLDPVTDGDERHDHQGETLSIEESEWADGPDPRRDAVERLALPVDVSAIARRGSRLSASERVRVLEGELLEVNCPIEKCAEHHRSPERLDARTLVALGDYVEALGEARPPRSVAWLDSAVDSQPYPWVTLREVRAARGR